MPPKKDTVTSTSGSKASTPAGQGAGVKRPTTGNTPAPGSEAAPGNRPAPGMTRDVPVRPGSGHYSPPRSNTSDSNPSRPGSSGGYHLYNFSYSHVGPGKAETAINSDSVEFRLIADAYHIGWQRFNHAETKNHLVHLGRECAKAWTNPGNKSKYGSYIWPGELEKIPTYLNNYLKGLQATTPAIVKRALEPSEGQTYAICQHWASYKGNLDSVLVTRDLFYLHICDLVPAHLLDAYEKHEDDRYQQLRTATAASFFHELCHGWVFFMMGPSSHETVPVGTPPEFRAGWDQPDELSLEAEIGESGYYIEDLIFGASLDIHPWLQPLGPKNVQYRLTCVNGDGHRRVVPTHVAKAFNKDPKGYDIKKDLINLFKPAAMKRTQGRVAKRQKTNHTSSNLGSKSRRHAWNLEFQFNIDHSAVTGLNKTATAPV